MNDMTHTPLPISSLVAEEGREPTIVPRRSSNWMLWTIAGFFVAFILWAALSEIDRRVAAQGRVIPNTQLQTVSNLEGGIVSAILVRPGQTVRAGDILIQLDRTQSGAEFGSGIVAIAALEARAARLTAEAQGGAPNWSRASFGPAEIINAERSLYNTRMAEYSSIAQQGRARVSQAQLAVMEAESVVATRRSALEAAQSEYQMIRPMVDRGIEPQMSLVRAQSAVSGAQSELSGAMSAVTRARAGVSEANAAMRQSQQDWRARAGLDLTTTNAELAGRRRTMPALADRVSRTAVVAPVAGRVNRILMNTIGGSAAPGSPLIELVPSRDELIVEVTVNPKDISAVRMAQPASVSLTAYDSSVYGKLDGSVISISPDATVDERTGLSFYTVRVKTKSNALRDKNGKPLPITPGMVADVSLLGEKRSILSYLLSPITKLSNEAFRE